MTPQLAVLIALAIGVSALLLIVWIGRKELGRPTIYVDSFDKFILTFDRLDVYEVIGEPNTYPVSMGWTRPEEISDYDVGRALFVYGARFEGRTISGEVVECEETYFIENATRWQECLQRLYSRLMAASGDERSIKYRDGALLLSLDELYDQAFGKEVIEAISAV